MVADKLGHPSFHSFEVGFGQAISIRKPSAVQGFHSFEVGFGRAGVGGTMAKVLLRFHSFEVGFGRFNTSMRKAG